mmetsp:Transcript_25421/g.79650  ORF Transcript_25421/g.79650 Transcript_25421/m.79650 type:complete len:190 (-) Transcript_25421:86-655(-)
MAMAHFPYKRGLLRAPQAPPPSPSPPLEPTPPSYGDVPRVHRVGYEPWLAAGISGGRGSVRAALDHTEVCVFVGCDGKAHGIQSWDVRRPQTLKTNVVAMRQLFELEDARDESTALRCNIRPCQIRLGGYTVRVAPDPPYHCMLSKVAVGRAAAGGKAVDVIVVGSNGGLVRVFPAPEVDLLSFELATI